MTTLENAAAVLRLFQLKGVTQGHVGLSFSEVVEALRLPKSSVSRLLSTMESQGLLERDMDTRGYHIGRVLLAAAGRYLSAPLVDNVSAAMARLVARTGCMGYVSMLDGQEALVMRIFHGRHFMPMITPPGSRMPASATSTGRVLLAQLSDEEVLARFHDHWPASPANAPQSPEALCARLAEVRQQGWSLARNESLPGISSLSVIVHNKHYGETVALCLSFLSLEAEPGFPPALLDALRATATEMTEKYGA